MPVGELLARWSSRELTELNAYFIIEEEDEREFNPEHRSPAEQRAYLKGMSDSAAKKAKAK